MTGLLTSLLSAAKRAWMLRSGAPLAQNIVPRRMVYSVNRSAARYFRLVLTERLARQARQIFE
jgi:hypothetical protein